jgi:hypothetical protein
VGCVDRVGGVLSESPKGCMKACTPKRIAQVNKHRSRSLSAKKGSRTMVVPTFCRCASDLFQTLFLKSFVSGDSPGRLSQHTLFLSQDQKIHKRPKFISNSTADSEFIARTLSGKQREKILKCTTTTTHESRPHTATNTTAV